jgi:dienelactone hydrolase
MRQLVRNAWTVGRDAAHRRPSLLRVRPAYENSLATVGSAGIVNDSGTVRSTVNGAGPSAPRSGTVLDATKVRSPLLMLCGTDDQVWPAGPMASTLAAQRHAAGCDHDDELVVYSGAGHLIRLGLLPTDAQWTGSIALGGSREGQARAQADATSRVLAFLASHTVAVTPAHHSAL